MIAVVLLTALLIPFAASLTLVPLVRRVAIRKGWVDTPDQERKLHARPTPSVGGMAIIAGFFIGLLGLFVVREFLPFELAMPRLAFLVGAVVIICTGIYDDLYKIGFKQKILIQITVAYLLLHVGFRFDVSGLPFINADPYNQTLYSAALTMLWVVGVINAVNLIDGLDGLASGVAIIAFSCLALIFGLQGDWRVVAISLLMVGALAGFLVYNFNPASIFMGDSGSLFVGYMMAVFVLDSKAHPNSLIAILVPVIALGIPLFDTALSFVRRLLDGKSPFAPDHDHIHHRLARLWSTRRAVLVLYGVALWFGIAAILMARLEAPYGFAVAGLTLVTAFIGVRILGYFDFRKTALRKVSADTDSQLSFNFDDLDAERLSPSYPEHPAAHQSRLLSQPEWVVALNSTNGHLKPVMPWSIPREVTRVSVIVPVHHGGAAFTRCLEALTASSPAPDEIIVVAEGETDGVWRQALDAEILVLKYETAKGPAYARNIGAEAASGDILFFVDADVVVPPDTIGRIKQAFQSDPELSGVIGSYDDTPADKGFLSQYRNLMHHHVHQTSSEEVSTFWTGCGAIRRQTFFAAGGFSESYDRPCIEDIEFGYRLGQRGEKVRIVKDIQVKHLKRWTARSMIRTDFFDRALPWTELIFKYHKLENNLNLHVTSRLSVISVYVLVVALAASLWYGPFLGVAGSMGVLLVILNASFYRFLLRRRGVLFTLAVLPWHWFYYLYGGLAFLIGAWRNLSLLGEAPAAASATTPVLSPPEFDLAFAWEAELSSVDLRSKRQALYVADPSDG